MIGLQSANPSLMMGRSLAALEEGIRFPDRSPLEAIETEVAFQWGYDHVSSRLPDTIEGAMAANALAAVSTCFPSIEALDACSSDLYVWLVAMNGPEGMRAMSDAHLNAVVRAEAAADDADGRTRVRETMLAGIADMMEQVCSFRLDALPAASSPRICLCEGVFHTEFLQEDRRRQTIVAETPVAVTS